MVGGVEIEISLHFAPFVLFIPGCFESDLKDLNLPVDFQESFQGIFKIPIAQEEKWMKEVT